jgi:hypothetical protein
VVAILPIDRQARIKASVDEAEQARRRAHALLERAKRAVEIAIEESEAAALRFLEAGGGNGQNGRNR